MNLTEFNYDGEVIAGRRYAFEVVEPLGLCARPSAILARAFQEMSGGIIIGNHEREGDARSIMQIMMLCAERYSTGFLIFSETQSAVPLKATTRVIRICEANDEE